MNINDLAFRYRALFPIPLAIFIFLIAKPTVLSTIIGTIFIILGEALRIICLGYLGVKSRDEKPNIANLVTSGPYSFSRNPIYIANIIIALGFSIIAVGDIDYPFNILIPLLVVLIYFSVYNYLIIPAEEKFLEQKFKENYLIYKSQVPRWLINFRKLENSFGKFRLLPVIKAEPWTWILITFFYILILFKGKILKI